MDRPYRLVTIGASSGGRAAITKMFTTMPGDIHAAFLVTVHGAFDMPSFFDVVLKKTTTLSVIKAKHGMKIEPGKIYIAEPNKHLFVREGKMILTSGPRENLFRPSIDVLFRSAAVAYGNRCIGILMSGRLNDGTTGLEAIKKCGGIAIIQEPDSAEYGDMPSFAKDVVTIDHELPLEDISQTLQEIVSQPLPNKVETPPYLIRENEIVNKIGSNIPTEDKLGHQVPISCPSCSGPLWELEDTAIKRYRCHVGHSFTEPALLKSQNEALEEALWISMRTLEEKKCYWNECPENIQKEKAAD